MTFDIHEKEQLIKHRLEKADKAIEEVRFLLDNEMLTLAVNRIYYGMFYAVSALALQHDFTTSKHKQLLGWFNKNFVKDNIVDRKLGEFIRDAFDSRAASDYGDWITFSRDEVSALFDGMQEFIQAIRKLLNMQGREENTIDD